MSLSASKQVLHHLRRRIHKETGSLATTSFTGRRVISTANNSSIFAQHYQLKNVNHITHTQIRTFSDVSATKEDTATKTIDVELNDIGDDKTLYKVWTPSVLETLPENYSAEEAWTLLKSSLPGNKQIRHVDFASLCQASKASSPEDAEAIRQALVRLKRLHHFKLTVGLAKDAMEGIARSMTNDDGSAQDAISAISRVANIFVHPKSGLYVAADIEVVENTILKPLLQAMERLEEGNSGSNDEEDERPEEIAIKTAKEVYNTLFLRASNPTRDMRKRAKRRYLKYLKNCSGPSPETLDIVTKICLKAENAYGVTVSYGIVNKFAERGAFGVVSESTMNFLQEVEEKVKAAEAETETEEENMEDTTQDEDKN